MTMDSSSPTMNVMAYSEDQNDALQEVVNIAMGQAGKSLALILGNFVELSIPRIRLICVEDVVQTVSEMVGDTSEIAAARQAFSNALHGESIVIFSQNGTTDLTECMGYDSDLDDAGRQEVLLEVTNLLVGAIINGISEVLDIELSFSAPSLMAENTRLDKVLIPEQLPWTHALLMEVNFTVENRDIHCHQLMFMTEDTIDCLRDILDSFIESI